MVARAAALLLLAPSVSGAQEYDFSIPRMDCSVSIESDASIQIWYGITFECAPGAHPIDIVDIGFPTAEYDPGSVRAEIDGEPLGGIRRSEYVPIGVEIPLGDRAIPPGGRGTLTVSAVNPHMVFHDEEDASYASTVFSPTWFDGSFLSGSTEYSILVRFPPGSVPDSVRYHGTPCTGAWTEPDGGRVVYEWTGVRRMDHQEFVGVSFPARLVTGEIRDEYDPWAGYSRPGPPLAERICPVALCIGIPGFMAILVVAGIATQRARRLKYMPPRIGVEGTGIKRGLTAPQAALLLELPLEKVTALIMYGLVLKDALSLSSDDGRPVLVKRDPPPEGLHEYETGFLAAVASGEPGRKAIDDSLLGSCMVAMVKDLEERMKGFSASETRDYYRTIIAQAWARTENAGAAAAAASIVEEQLQWMMMDGDFDSRLRRSSAHPAWTGPFIPGPRTAGLAASGGPATSVVDFCSRIASTLETAADGAVSSFSGLTARVTGVTNPVPVSTGVSRGGGGGCACACACAGCACACAGGGR